MYNSLYGTGQCLDQLKSCATTGDNQICADADNFCAADVEFVYDDVLNRDEYDIRELQPDPFPPVFYVDYLNTPEVQVAIGAFVNFSEFSAAVGNAFNTTGDDGREDGTVEATLKLLEKGVTVMLYYGDSDYNCNWYVDVAIVLSHCITLLEI